MTTMELEMEVAEIKTRLRRVENALREQSDTKARCRHRQTCRRVTKNCWRGCATKAWCAIQRPRSFGWRLNGMSCPMQRRTRMCDCEQLSS